MMIIPKRDLTIKTLANKQFISGDTHFLKEDSKSSVSDESSLSSDSNSQPMGTEENLQDNKNKIIEIRKNMLTQSPPDFKLAEIHWNANLVKDLSLASKDLASRSDINYFCPWCQLPTTKAAPSYDLWWDNFELNDLGSGVPLYHNFIIYIGVVFFLMTLIVAIPWTILSAMQKNLRDWTEGEEPTYFAYVSIGTFGNDPKTYDTPSAYTLVGLNTIMICVFYITIPIFRNIQGRMTKKIDEKVISPGDFAIMVSNIPKTKSEEDVKWWIISLLPEAEIEEINFAYDIKEVVGKIRRIERLKRKRGKPDQDFDKIERDISELKKEVEELKKKMNEGSEKFKSTGIVFVILNKQSQAEELVSMFERGLLLKIWNLIWISVFRWRNRCMDKTWWDGNRVSIERAAEPTDIFWENMSVTFFSRIKFKILTGWICLWLLGIAFGINFSLTMLSQNLEQEAEKSKSQILSASTRLIVLTKSTVIALMNVILKKIMRKLSLLEKDATFTRFNLSVSIKEFIVTALNTILIPVFTNIEAEQWFDSGGFILEIFFNVTIASFITPLSYLLNPTVFFKKFKIYLAKRKGENWKLTQRELNILYEGPSYDVAKGYSETLLILAVSAFFTPLLPIIPIIAFFGIIFQYWIKKYSLLRINKIPETMGEDLDAGLASSLPFIGMLYAAGLYYFINSVSSGHAEYMFPLFFCHIIYYIIPKEILFKKCEFNISRDDLETYRKNKDAAKSVTWVT
jgi:hypothetical protein